MAEEKQKDTLYQAVKLGSGAFKITKPKRSATKINLTRVHDPRKRARRH
jgi:hypothetical protein